MRRSGPRVTLPVFLPVAASAVTGTLLGLLGVLVAVPWLTSHVAIPSTPAPGAVDPLAANPVAFALTTRDAVLVAGIVGAILGFISVLVSRSLPRLLVPATRETGVPEGRVPLRLLITGTLIGALVAMIVVPITYALFSTRTGAGQLTIAASNLFVLASWAGGIAGGLAALSVAASKDARPL